MEEQLLRRITERVWALDPTVETDRPKLGYIRGDDYSVMVDAGNSPAHVRLFFDRLREEGLPLPKYCLITHWHWDHTFGICGLPVPAVCGRRTAELLAGCGEADIAAMVREDPCMQAEYPDPSAIRVQLPELVFDGSLCFDLGCVRVEMMYVGGPHSEDSCLIWVPEEQVLFAGDSSSGNFSLPRIAYDLPLLDAHERILRSIPFTAYIHAHRPVMTREETFAFLDAGRKRGYYTFD